MPGPTASADRLPNRPAALGSERRVAVTVVVGTDPNDVDVCEAVVVVPGPDAARRVVGRKGLAVIARPAALPLASSAAATVRADGLFGSPPARSAPDLVAELVRITTDEGVVVATAQIDPGPAGAHRPVDAEALAALLPGEPVVEPFHDRVCRKDWHRLIARVPCDMS